MMELRFLTGFVAGGAVTMCLAFIGLAFIPESVVPFVFVFWCMVASVVGLAVFAVVGDVRALTQRSDVEGDR